MKFPETLQNAIEQELVACSHQELSNAVQQMILHYRAEKSSGLLFQNRATLLAYLTVRMPATFAAISAVFRECRERLPDWRPRTFVDIGAGPGTGAWAALEWFSALQTLWLVEPSQPMMEVGRRLCASLLNTTWSRLESPPADLALLSYVVAELKETQREEMMERLWKTSEVIVVIEPGTPAGYRRIIQIRDWALRQGAYLIAPCPHRAPCPMQPPQWCHFPARVERTRLHKLLKKGTLGYEDEKWSYLIFGKIPPQPFRARIVGPPKKASGFVQLPLCDQDGKLKDFVVTRRQKEYRQSREAEYGSSWN